MVEKSTKPIELLTRYSSFIFRRTFGTPCTFLYKEVLLLRQLFQRNFPLETWGSIHGTSDDRTIFFIRCIGKMYMGDSMRTHPLFLERFFFSIFFRLKHPIFVRKHFWWKKIGSYLWKTPSFLAFFRYTYSVFSYIEKMTEKRLELHQKLFFRNFLVLIIAPSF